MDFPRTLSLLRQEKKISQRKAAGELGVSQALLSHYENGVRADKTVREALSDYSSSMVSYARGDGGFGYWPGAEKSDFRMTSYAVRALGEIRALGISVDQSLMNGASSYLKKEFYANKRP